MMLLLSGCCVMDLKSSTAPVNISLNSGSERKLFLFIMRTPHLLPNKESGQNPVHYTTLNTVVKLLPFISKSGAN